MSNDLFEGLSFSVISLLMSRMRSREYQRKTFLVEPGAVDGHLYLIKRGLVKKHYINNEGKERIFEFGIPSNWIFDVKGFTENQPASFAIETLENTHVGILAKDDYKDLCEDSEELRTYFEGIIYRTMLSHEKRMRQLMACSAKNRYEDFQEDYPGLELRVSQKHIAAYLGITPEFLSNMKSRMI